MSHLMFNEVRFVDSFKITLVAPVELARVFTHVCVQVA